MVDDLIRLRAFFYTANYVSAIEEFHALESLSAQLQSEAEWFFLRSLVAENQFDQANQLASNSPHAQAVRILLDYYQFKKPFDKNRLNAKSYESSIAAAIVMFNQRDIENAFKAVVPWEGTMDEAVALKIFIYLELQRRDLAEKELFILKQRSNDSVLSQICEAVLQSTMEKEDQQQAYYTFAELADGYGRSSFCILGQAVCCMHLDRHSEAEGLLNEILRTGAINGDALANLTTAAVHLASPGDLITKLTTALFGIVPKHAFVTEWEARSQLFDQCAAKYIQ